MTTDQLRGIYILGKAATLNGRIGDVMIANVVYDEHSGNTYWFDNCFSYDDLAPVPGLRRRAGQPEGGHRQGHLSSRTRAISTSTTARTTPSSRWRPAPT